MQVSSEDKAIIKILCQFKEYGSRKILEEFANTNYKSKKLNTLLKKIQEIGSTDQRHESGRPKHACTEENVTHCG